MTMVRDIVKQVIEGCRDLSQKNVVHCDLKPENILLLSQEANLAVVAAGDSRSRSDGSVVSHLGTAAAAGAGASSQETGRATATSSTGGGHGGGGPYPPSLSSTTNSHATTME